MDSEGDRRECFVSTAAPEDPFPRAKSISGCPLVEALTPTVQRRRPGRPQNGDAARSVRINRERNVPSDCGDAIVRSPPQRG
jgi:hypothetical protein